MKTSIKHPTTGYPFGMLMPGRSISTTAYRFGFNTQEKDDEICGAGNSNTAMFWEYSTRLGRRWNLDPKPNASLSSYSTFTNNPILFNDVSGDTVGFATPDDFANVLMNSILSTDYAKKINDLRKSDITYTFQAVKYDPNNGVKGGKTSLQDDDPCKVIIQYTTGDNPMNKKDGIGLGPNNSIWEETFHAWDYNQGGVNLRKGTAFDEAEAWKFSSNAPGTKFEFQNYSPEDKKSYTDKTAMFRINTASTIQVALWLKNGMPNKYDKATKIGYSGLSGDPTGQEVIGLYKEMPLK